jgi:enterochelin esterase family protein
VALFRVRSAILGNERRVWIYTPPNHTAEAAPCGLLVLFDGLVYINDIPTPTILDNLLADGAIPPLIMVSVCSLDGETRERELACHPPFVQFPTDELLPWMRQRYPITTRPDHTIIGGSSYGGMAALFAGLGRPDVFGNVLAQSGAAWWRPDGDPEAEWLARQFAASERLPLRFALDVGLFENTRRLADDGPSQLVATRHLRTVLRARGYPVHYAEFAGGHSALNWRGTFGEAVRALVG